MAKSASKKPVHEVRFSNIKAVIWANDTANGVMHNVTVARVYKDGEDWKESSGFGRDDLLVLAKALDEAHTWIHSQKAA